MKLNLLTEKRIIETEPIDIPLDEIGEKYGKLRIINPSSESSMLKSIEKYGQLSPVVVSREEDIRYELLDGFKRFHACLKLQGINKLKCRPVSLKVHACKAAILLLNWVGKLSDMEEAMVVQSLYREDALTQVEIAVLLNRHKSWVCRRISLVERLTEAVQENIKLGLISVSIGREVAKLPRGNQEAAVSAIQKHGLTRRETEKLVSTLMSRPKSEHEGILCCPEKIISNKSPGNNKPTDNRLSQAGLIINRKLISMANQCLNVVTALNVNGLSSLTENDILCLSPIMGRSTRAAQLAAGHLNKTISAYSNFKSVTNSDEKNKPKIISKEMNDGNVCS